MAFVGVRPCDLSAIGIQDQVLGRGEHAGSRYAARRSGVFIVAVNCTEPGATCFCTSMGTGPEAGPGYDLALTELVSESEHKFLVDIGSQPALTCWPMCRSRQPTAGPPAGQVRGRAGGRPDGPHDAGRCAARADGRQLRRRTLGRRRARCLTCGNCTMACPTCFCTTVEDVSDLSGEHAERWQLWDSCFSLSFSYLPGGPSGRQPQQVPAVAYPQARHLARPVRQLRLRRLRAVHRLVPGRHRPDRGGRRPPG